MVVKPVNAAPASPAPDPWSVSTSLRLPRFTNAVSLTSPQPGYRSREDNFLPGHLSMTSLKRESPTEENSQPKRIRQTEGQLIHEDSDESDLDSLFGDDDLDATLDEVLALGPAYPSPLLAATPAFAPAAPPSAPPTARTLFPRSVQRCPACNLSGGSFITMKMHKFGDLELRANGCRKELQRIAADITIVHKDTAELVRTGRSKWLVDRLITLGEEKQAVTAVLDKTTRRQQAKQRRLEKRRKQEAGKKCRLEAKRLSNKQQVKNEGGRKVPYVDMTQAVIVKVEPGTTPESVNGINVESKPIIKQEVVEEEPKVKVEPRIKIEED